MSEAVWFWQVIVSPHAAELSAALAATGREVVYVAQQQMSAARATQGWKAPTLCDVSLHMATTADAIRALVRTAPADSVHICQGLRSNGLVGVAQRAIAARGLRQWVVMETVEATGWRGVAKRLEYRRLLRACLPHLQGLLAIGDATPRWLIERGAPADRVFPFAYFLREPEPCDAPFDHTAPFRFLFVGRLIQLKRVDLLIDALARLSGMNFEFETIGSGPLESTLRIAAERALPGRTRWLGQRPIELIPRHMAEADCLVLPSRHDGWGAVVSEALLAGTPAICSDACGASGVARASGQGGVFHAGDVVALTDQLRAALSQGRQTPERRAELAAWAQCLGARAGAGYLDGILKHANDAIMYRRPLAPWLREQLWSFSAPRAPCVLPASVRDTERR